MPESGRWGLHPYQTESSAFPLLLELGWLAYVRAGYRDSANNESHFTHVLSGLVHINYRLLRLFMLSTRQGNSEWIN